jgi:ATP-dependent Clp protease ATP-binding subunit ClpX
MTDKKNIIHTCSFCGQHKDLVKKLIVSDNGAICSSCIELCNQLLLEETSASAPETSVKNMKPFDAYAIKNHLDSLVIGQEDAKIVLSVAIANHYKRINNPPTNIELNKGNVLLIGPTGSGKTLLARSVAKYLNVPFVVADATNLTEAGYVGDDVESMITMLLSNANGDIQMAERGIIFIDEIDKISRKSENNSLTRDVSGEGVQQALLKLVEGTKCRISTNVKRKSTNSEVIEIDTKNILFIAGGAFVGLNELVSKREVGSTIGFGAKLITKKVNNLETVTPEDLVKFGMIPEFVGRFTTTIALEELSLEQLVSVLTIVKNSFIEQYKYLFSIDDIELAFTPEAINQIAQNCIDLKTGARGLQNELEKVLLPHMYHVEQYKNLGLTKLEIDHDLVINPKSVLPK